MGTARALVAAHAPAAGMTPAGETHPLRERLRSVSGDTWWMLLALVGVAVSATLLGWSLRPSYFQSDDFVNVNLSREMSFGWTYLQRSLFGHFLPGYRLAIAAYDDAFGGRWWPAIVFQCGSLVMCALLIDCLGRLLRASAAVRCVAVLAFSFSLLHIRSVVWFAAALNSWPVNILSLVVLLSVLMYVRTARWWWCLLAAAALGAGMTFLEQTLTVGFALAAMAILYREEMAPGVAGRVFWRRAATVGGACLAVLLVYWGYYFSHTYSDELPERSGIGPVVRFGWYALFEGLFPALVGLRITSADATPVRMWTVVAGVVAVVLLAGAAASRRRRTWRAWAVGAAVVLPHVALVAVGRVGKAGPAYGRELRYFADVVWLVPLVLFLATSGVPRTIRLARRHLSAIAVVAGVAFVAVSVQAAREVRSEFRVSTGWASGRYFERFAATAPAAGSPGFSGVYDTQVPCCIQIPQLYPYSLVSKVIGLYDERAMYRLAPSHMVQADGSVVRARFQALQELDLPDTCVDVSGSYVDIPLGTVTARAAELFVRAEWTPGSAAGAVGVVGGPTSAPAATGHASPFEWIQFSDADEVVVIPLIHDVPDALWLRFAGTGEVCLSRLVLGRPEPADSVTT
ncbi:hypothetical protein [Desertimonas flava]|uniref:hypothetical protein n=1 Tax=Desertimonas flava TaxID=2064846 RepID=UPI0013C49114|nr:hypothetical protein [Desertimonas flava]